MARLETFGLMTWFAQEVLLGTVILLVQSGVEKGSEGEPFLHGTFRSY